MVDCRMDWPSKLDVLIDYGEEEIKEKSCRLLRSVPHYGMVYGPMAEYETADFEKFWIEAELLRKSKDEHKPPTIPVEVIRKNAEIQAKLRAGQAQLAHDKKQRDTGLLIPKGLDV